MYIYPLALKNPHAGSGLLFRGLRNSITPTPYYREVVGSVVVLLKGVKLLKLAACFVNFPSLVRNIFDFFCGQGQITSAPKSSWRQKQKITCILRAMHALYVCVLLASSEKRTRYCVQPRTG